MMSSRHPLCVPKPWKTALRVVSVLLQLYQATSYTANTVFKIEDDQGLADQSNWLRAGHGFEHRGRPGNGALG
jgi:hypothetical protein